MSEAKTRPMSEFEKVRERINRWEANFKEEKKRSPTKEGGFEE